MTILKIVLLLILKIIQKMKINFTIYRFSLLNKAKEQQVLSFYNEEEDLLETMNDFCDYIHKNIKGYTDNQGKYRTFTLSEKQNKNNEKRIISGYFDSAYTGEKGKVKYGKSNRLKCDINKKDLISKDFFYSIHVPEKSKFGFLIVQKKENHGVKSIFENEFNSFMRQKGVSNYHLELRQAPPRYFLKNFLQNGSLKEYKLISNTDEGREEIVFKLSKNETLKTQLKEVLVSLFNSNLSVDDKVAFSYKGEFDEISFVLELNGTTKTFYIKNKEKIRSNINVTDLIKFDRGEPIIQSLIDVSIGIIDSAA
jgi:hypothetical protein